MSLLTLDANIQQRAEEVLGAVGAVFDPKDATAIVMDPREGIDSRDGQLALQANTNDPGADSASGVGEPRRRASPMNRARHSRR